MLLPPRRRVRTGVTCSATDGAVLLRHKLPKSTNDAALGVSRGLHPRVHLPRKKGWIAGSSPAMKQFFMTQ